MSNPEIKAPWLKSEEILQQSGKEKKPLSIMLKFDKNTFKKIGGYMKKFFKMFVVLAMLVLPVSVSAIEMPDVSGNWAVFYNTDSGKFSSAPMVDVTMVTAFNGILKANFSVAFTGQNEIGTEWIGGGTLKVDFVKLLAASDKVEIIKGVNLEAGGGVLFDALHLKGKTFADIEKIVYPTFAIGFGF